MGERCQQGSEERHASQLRANQLQHSGQASRQGHGGRSSHKSRAPVGHEHGLERPRQAESHGQSEARPVDRQQHHQERVQDTPREQRGRGRWDGQETESQWTSEGPRQRRGERARGVQSR